MRWAALLLALGACTEVRDGITGTQSLRVELVSPADPGSPGSDGGTARACAAVFHAVGIVTAPGRVAQRESARLTRERSLVRTQPRPSDSSCRAKNQAVVLTQSGVWLYNTNRKTLRLACNPESTR